MDEVRKEIRAYDMIIRAEGREAERKKIAKRLKTMGLFTDEFISEITEVSIQSVRKMKAGISSSRRSASAANQE